MVESEDDLAAWVELRNRLDPEFPTTVEEQLGYDRWLSERERFLAGDAGYAIVTVEPARRGLGVAHSGFGVLPDRRRHGVGSALYRAVSRWTRAHGLDGLEVWVSDTAPEGREFAERHAFVEIVREERVALDLAAAEPPHVPPPPGIEIVTWADHLFLAHGLYQVSRECYPDIPGSEDDEPEPFADWLGNDMQGPNDRPEATFVAVERSEVVAYAKLHFPAVDTGDLMHDLTGVRRAWRGRGIARALKAHQIAWAKEAGYRRLVTNNEVRNEPIRRLNAEFGYVPVPGRARLRGPLAPEG